MNDESQMARRPYLVLRTLAAVAVILAVAIRVHALDASSGYASRDIALKAPNEEERQLLALINADRAVRDRKAIEWDGRMSAVAREHSQDMAADDYVDYVSPRLGTFEYRLHRAGV